MQKKGVLFKEKRKDIMMDFQMMQSNLFMLLIFSLLAVMIYYKIRGGGRAFYLLTINALFYILCDFKMFFLLAAVIFWTWICSRKLEERKDKKWLAFGICPLILLLFFFKYGFSNLLLPLGISYYSFKSISYLVDVYREKYCAEKNIVTYALYVSFFPEILCGPITRFDQFHKTLKEVSYSDENIQRGFYFILKGVFLKTVIANRLSGYVGTIFAAPASYTGLALWMAAFFYSIQIYCDFAGYSSIAVGITQLFGMHYTENFKRPYLSVDIREFWDRWHISLSNWLKDYIYIPLGGNRCTKWKQKRNVMAVFLVSSIWHGTGWNFILWGIWHGFLNSFTVKKQANQNKVRKVFEMCVNFFCVMLGWIFFRAASVPVAVEFLKGMFFNLKISSKEVQNAVLPFTRDNTCVAFFLTVLFFIAAMALREYWEEKKQIKGTAIASVLWQVFLLVSIILFGYFGISDFLYANF